MGINRIREHLEAESCSLEEIEWAIGESQLAEQLFQQYQNDPMSVPSEVRFAFDLIIGRRLPKAKDDEGFRFYLDDPYPTS